LQKRLLESGDELPQLGCMTDKVDVILQGASIATLPARSTSAAPACSAEVALDGSIVGRTSEDTVGGSNPAWNKKFQVLASGQSLRIVVFTKGMAALAPCGECTINLQDALRQGSRSSKLVRADGQCTGTVQFQISRSSVGGQSHGSGSSAAAGLAAFQARPAAPGTGAGAATPRHAPGHADGALPGVVPRTFSSGRPIVAGEGGGPRFGRAPSEAEQWSDQIGSPDATKAPSEQSGGRGGVTPVGRPAQAAQTPMAGGRTPIAGAGVPGGATPCARQVPVTPVAGKGQARAPPTPMACPGTGQPAAPPPAMAKPDASPNTSPKDKRPDGRARLADEKARRPEERAGLPEEKDQGRGREARPTTPCRRDVTPTRRVPPPHQQPAQGYPKAPQPEQQPQQPHHQPQQQPQQPHHQPQQQPHHQPHHQPQQQPQPQPQQQPRAQPEAAAGAQRLGLQGKAKVNVQELCQSKDKLREWAKWPFKQPEMQGYRMLGYPHFRAAVRGFCKTLDILIPGDKQIEAMFDKHRHGNKGVGVDDYEALLFRMLCFMLATDEVDVQPGRAAGGETRDQVWRQEFLRTNNKRFTDVYEFGKKLGAGTFGTVYQCTYRTTHAASERKTRVCKVIDKRKAAEVGTSLERVREEFAVLKRLDHPHVVRIFDDFEDEQCFCLVMEPCRGGDLQEAIRHPWTSDPRQWEAWVAKAMQHTLSAIAYCHSRGVIHKDLKPENIMMGSEKGAAVQDLHIVVVDFGLAEMFQTQMDRRHEIAGTPPYMAPEVWKGDFNKSCDIWSCGVILFQMLSGALPFNASRIEDFPQMLNHEPNWQMIGGASPQAQNICWRMLCKAEAARPNAQELLKDQWFAVHRLGGVDGAQMLDKHQIKNLIQVQERTYFEKFVARLVATQLDAGQQKRINEAFHAFDADKDGILHREELYRGLIMLGAKPDEATKVVNDLDVSGTGKISYTEFLAGVVDLRHKSATERSQLLWLAWQQFQPDEKGLVKTSAVQDALAARGLTVAELPKEFLAELRKGKTGEMEFEAFQKLFQCDQSHTLMTSFVGGFGFPRGGTEHG